MRSRCKSDEGFVLVLSALALVALLIFTAIVVDIGGVYAKRRDDQTAADVAALAAVQELNSPDKDTAMVAMAKQHAHQALGVTLTDAQWDSCPSAADDPGVLTNQIAAASCISYNAVRVRVRLPEQFWKTTFGGVIGRDSIRHSAFAIAGLEPEGFGGILPFAVTGTSAEGGLGCIKSNSNGQASSLCQSTTGNFGFLDFSHYGPTLGDPSFGTSFDCGSQGTSARIERNAAMGVDHELSLQGTVHLTPIADSPDACENGIETPDAAYTQVGNLETQITNGLFNCTNTNGTCPGGLYSDGKPARLQRLDADLFGGAGREIDGVAGVDNLDDNALWRFIPEDTGPNEPISADFPVSCKRDQFVTATGAYYSDITSNTSLDEDVREFLADFPTRDQMVALLNRCFKHYTGDSWDGTPVGSFQTTAGQHEEPDGCGDDDVCSAPVFSSDTDPTEDPNVFDIQRTARFGYVPEIADFPEGQSEERAFIRFKAVFIQRVVIEQTGNKYNFDPGFGPGYSGYSSDSDDFKDISSYARVGETLAFVFPKGMLPNRLSDDEAPFLLGVNRFPSLVR